MGEASILKEEPPVSLYDIVKISKLYARNRKSQVMQKVLKEQKRRGYVIVSLSTDRKCFVRN